MRRLEDIIDNTFGVKGKTGIKDSGRDLFSGELLGGVNIYYGNHIKLQAVLNGGFYNTNLEINTTHPDYNSFLEQCRTKIRKVYDKLTNTDSKVAGAV